MAEETRYSAEEVYGFAREAGFSPDQAATMTAIALAESGGRTDAHNPRGEDSRGLWQINVRAHEHLEDVDLYDPRVNAEAAYEVSRGGADISPWTVTHGEGAASYLRFRDEAQAAAEAAGDGSGLGAWEGVTGYGDRTPAGKPEPESPGDGSAVDHPTDATSGPEAPDENEALETFLESALAQTGDTYDFGAEVDLDDPDPDEFDCSELVQWAVHQAGATIPDGAIYQYRHLAKEGTTMSVEEALHTPGALLFRFSQDPSLPGRPASAHVAISLGDGRTIEARGKDYGVGSWDANETRFQYAGYVPAFGAEPLVEEPETTVETTRPETPATSAPATPEPPADPVLADLRELEETYNIAAQVLHDESVEALETKDRPELTDALYERGGLMAQLKALPAHRSGYEERRDLHREQADAFNAEYTRLEAEGRFEEAEEKLEEALREDARARLDQRRIEELDRREEALTERVEQLDQKVTELTVLEGRDSAAIAELETNADTLDDARRSVLDAIALREEAARLRLQAEQTRAEGDTARAEELEGQAADRVYASDVHRERVLETVPDNETVRRALVEAEELNRVSVVLVGEQEIEGAGAAEPLLPDAHLQAMRAEFDTASDALHQDALQQLRAGGEIQALEQHVFYDRAQGLGAELEHVRGQLVQDAKMVEARRGQAEKLREEAAELRAQGDEQLAEEKVERADRVDVLREMVERSMEWRTSREAQLTQEHREAMDAASAARKSALEHAGRESELEASADLLDDATRVLDDAVAARAEAHRLGVAANQARSAGDQQRAEELKEQSVQQMTRSNALTQQATTMVSGDVAAAAAVAEAHGADSAWSFDVVGEGADQAGTDPLSTVPLGVDPEGQAPLPGEMATPEEEDLLGETGVPDQAATAEGLDPVVPLPRDPEEALEPAFHEQSRFDDDLEAEPSETDPMPVKGAEPARMFAEPEPEPHPEPDTESAFFSDHATPVKGAEPVPSADEPGDSFE